MIISAYSFGKSSSSSLGDYTWYSGNADDILEKYAHKISQKKANARGLYDMHGNVFEWCSDWYDLRPSTDPQGHDKDSMRVARGGNWKDYEWCCESAKRRDVYPVYRDNDLGFRLVKEI